MAIDRRKSNGLCTAFAPLLPGGARPANSSRTISSRALQHPRPLRPPGAQGEAGSPARGGRRALSARIPNSEIPAMLRSLRQEREVYRARTDSALARNYLGPLGGVAGDQLWP